MKKIIIAILVAVIGITAYLAYTVFGSVTKHSTQVVIYLDREDNLDSLKNKVINETTPSTTIGFDISVKLLRMNKIRTGRYTLEPGISMMGILRMVRSHSQSPINVVIPSVRTLDMLVGRISSQLMIDSAEIAQALQNDSLITTLGYNNQSLPGLFIPNTYEMYWDISTEDFLNRMQKENNKFWNKERKAKAEAMELDENQVATLASIVDSETAYNPEKARIAGLYLNRIKKGMLLQSDPTVIFAIGDFSIRRVLNSHLTVDSPYNTYLYKGLPPGPIRIPSIAGLDAVLNHETNNYLYMCAKEDFSGSHNFASTYNEHLANARRYVKALNQRGIK